MADTRFFAIVTDLGTKEMLEAVNKERKVNITHFAVGDGGGQYYVPDTTMTELKNEVWRGKIGSCRISEESENVMIAETTIPSDAGGFTIREMAVFDDKNTMIAVCNTPDTAKVKVTDGVVHELLARMEIVLNNKESVELLVDPHIVTATKKDLQNLAEKLQWLLDSYPEHKYSRDTEYKPGDYCIQDNALYRCIENTTGEWNGTCWENTEIVEEMGRIQQENTDQSGKICELEKMLVTGNVHADLVTGDGKKFVAADGKNFRMLKRIHYI